MEIQAGTTSRRTFLRGAALGAVGLASAGMLGACSPKEPSTSEGKEEAQSDGSGQARLDKYSSGRNWLGAPPEISDDQITETKEYDIVVVGSGHAGSQVALAAVQSGGVSVGVIDEQAEAEFTENGSEIGHFNSKLLLETHGLKRADVGEVVNEFVRCGNGNVKPTIIKKYVENSGEMFDNFWDILQETEEGRQICQDGWYFVHTNANENGEFDPSMYPIVENGARSWAGCAMFKIPEGSTDDPSGGRGHTGIVFLTCMIEKAKSLGAEYSYEQKGVVLTQDESGRVTGVIAEGPDGSYTKYTATKGVAICTGDFSSNGEMCWALLDEIAEWKMRNGISYEDAMASWTGPSGRNGSGHKMCSWAGGVIEPSPRACQDAGGGADGPWGYAPLLQLNANGERFMNEADYYSLRGAVARQPYGTMAVVTDANYMKSVSKGGVYHGGPNFGRPEFYPRLTKEMAAAGAAPGPEPHNVTRCSVRYGAPQEVYAANTIEELAEYLGYKGESAIAFAASVAHYNELCETGVDSDFGKQADCMIPVNQPPFYACKTENKGLDSIGLVTLAGMVTDNDFNVLDADGSPIEGLYVAGNTLGGRYNLQYPTPVAGNSLGMAMTHGRLLGKYLAEK